MLAIASWRRNRAVSAGLLFIGLAWLPTANLLFPTGVVIAERTLYLATAGAALVAAEGARAAARRWGSARVAVAVVAVALVFAGRSAEATPVWRSSRDLVLRDLLAHPESYRVHQAAARVLKRLGRPRASLAEYGVSAELYPLEVPNLVEAAQAAADAGDARLARRFLVEAERPGWAKPLTEWGRAYVDLRTGTPVAFLVDARRHAAAAPSDAAAARILAGAFLSAGWPDSARAVWPSFLGRGGSPFVGWLYRASTFVAVGGMPDSARLALDSATAHAPGDPAARADLGKLRALVAGSGPTARPLR